MAVGVSDRIAKIIEKMELGDSFEAKLRRILEWNIQSRLAEYEMINRRFRQKYQMSLEEFEKNDMLEKLNYSFEVESDYHDWDMAVDGITSQRTRQP
jgi:hypothetical protein